MESLQEERLKNKKMEGSGKIESNSEVVIQSLDTLEKTNILLRELNLTLSDRLF